MMAMFALIAISFVGAALFKAVGFGAGERLAEWMRANTGTVMFAVLILNTTSQQLLQTGAFEIEVGNQIVWSKLQSGSLPTRDFVMAIPEKFGGLS